MRFKHRGRWFAASLALVAVIGCGSGGGGADSGDNPPPVTSTAGEPNPGSTPVAPTDGPAAEDVPQASGAFPQAPRNTAGQVYTIDFLNMVVQHADQQIWVPYFKAIGLQEPMVDVVYVGSEKHPTYTSKCDLNDDGRGSDLVQPDSPNAWYCPADGGDWKGALILPVTTFTNMWSGQVLGKLSQKPGDAAGAAVVAHEFGHHIADELATQLSIPEAEGTLGPELFADCLAGIWMAGAGAHGFLEDGDLEEAVYAMIALGVNGSATHGNATQRFGAFMLGWRANHVPYECMKQYWPAMSARMAR